MDLIKQLLNLKNELKYEFRDFPRNCCMEAVKRASDFGLEETFGLFIDDYGIGHNHHWSRKNGKIYDITAFQFGNKFPEVYVLDENSSEAEKHYEEGIYLMI